MTDLTLLSFSIFQISVDSNTVMEFWIRETNSALSEAFSNFLKLLTITVCSIAFLYLATFLLLHQFKIHSSKGTHTRKVDNKTKIKKKPTVYKSDDGLGYWVRGYGDDLSYVPITALYPEGTDMDELEQLKLNAPKQSNRS